MITIEIMGGLGNQLFQIFALIHTSIQMKQPFYFERKKTSTREDRPFYWNNFLKRLSIFQKENDTITRVYREPCFHFESIPEFPRNETMKLVGYFQSPKYFEDSKTTIFNMIHLKKQQEEIKQKFHIDFFQSTISLHFRIGDYKHIQQHHPVMKLEYYINALDALIRDTQKGDWNVLCFFEKQNKEEVQNHIQNLKAQFSNLTFTEINHGFEDWVQLLVMSLCQHNIIANSSFSWWGAYMNENENKNRVYYPSTWFGPAQDDKNTEDLFLKRWNKINTHKI